MNVNDNIFCDAYGRSVNYLRLSVTDHCNLHCTYCCNHAQDKTRSHRDILRYEEMLTLVKVAQNLGIKKVRLTGGEPFVRKGFMELLASLHANFPEIDLRITTNGTLIYPHILALKSAGIKVINVSLDSFQPKTFKSITGQDLLETVLNNIDELLDANIAVKLNIVAMRGITDVEMESFVHFAMQKQIDVRFIEFMPMGSETTWDKDLYISAKEIIQRSSSFALLKKTSKQDKSINTGNIDIQKNNDFNNQSIFDSQKESKFDGPATMYTIEGSLGRIGTISAISNHFCATCNRLRITSDGHLRSCLFADSEYDLRPILRNTYSDEELSKNAKAKQELEQKLHDAFIQELKNKPLGEVLLKNKNARAVAKKHMVSIGG